MAAILIHADAAAAISATGLRLLNAIKTKPDVVLGLATGRTMEPVYADLIERVQSGGQSFSGVRSFNLDEYIGLSGKHQQSYRQTMNRLLFSHIDIPLAQTYLPIGDTDDPAQEALDYEKRIELAGGIDLQLLGIGSNGHIGFNEPSASLGSRTRIKRLTASTIKANSGFFGSNDAVPSHAITMGIATIMDARKILLVATGEGKAEAVAKALEGPVSTSCPASALQYHPGVSVILDQEAAVELKLRDYYEEIHPNGRELYFRS